MKFKTYNIALLIVVLGLIAVAVFLNYTPQSISQTNSGSSKSFGIVQQVIYEPATQEDYQRLEDILPNNEIIQKLPGDAKINLVFFIVEAGEWVSEKNYIITTGDVVQGSADDADMNLFINSKYLSKLTENNFCTIIKGAKSNGDFASQLQISTTSLLWKYKSIMSYKDCLGL